MSILWVGGSTGGCATPRLRYRQDLAWLPAPASIGVNWLSEAGRVPKVPTYLPARATCVSRSCEVAAGRLRRQYTYAATPKHADIHPIHPRPARLASPRLASSRRGLATPSTTRPTGPCHRACSPTAARGGELLLRGPRGWAPPLPRRRPRAPDWPRACLRPRPRLLQSNGALQRLPGAADGNSASSTPSRLPVSCAKSRSSRLHQGGDAKGGGDGGRRVTTRP